FSPGTPERRTTMPLPLPEGPVSRTIRRGTRDGGGGLVTAVQSRSAAAPRQIRSTPSDPRRAGTGGGHGGGGGAHRTGGRTPHDRARFGCAGTGASARI